MRRVGIAYREPLSHWINSYPDDIACVEITAEHFFDSDTSRLSKLNKHYPIYLHAIGLSLGTKGELESDYLQKFNSLCQTLKPRWISEHIAFTKTKEVDLGHLNPIPYNHDSLDIMVDNALQLIEYCDTPLILENITSHLVLPNTLSDAEFINRLCERAGCGLLLDVTNLFINSKNHHYDAKQWIDAINPEYVRQLHVVGYSQNNSTYEDNHAQATQHEILELVQHVAHYPNLEAVIIERDQLFPEISELQKELATLGTYLD